MMATICRLCFTQSENKHKFKDIFENENSAVCMVQFIEKYFHCQVYKVDPLPNVVCNGCCKKIQFFHKFVASTKTNHDQFYQNLNQNGAGASEILQKQAIKTEQTENEPEDDGSGDMVEFGLSSSNQAENVENTENAQADNKVNFEVNVDDEMEMEEDPTKREFENDKANDLPIIAADKRELVVKEFFDLNCDICGTKTSSLKNAQEHYLNQHNNFNGYMKCCNKQLKTERAVEEHIRLHINPFVFQCTKCKVVHFSSYKLYNHMTMHMSKENGQLACSQCDRRFAFPKQLKIHMKRNHNPYKSRKGMNKKAAQEKTD